MIASTIKQFLVVFAATAIALYLLERAKEPPAQHSYHTRHGACAQVGVRNHSGVEPYDPFGFCSNSRGRGDYGGRDLPDNGR
jgi:hypothetical protein